MWKIDTTKTGMEIVLKPYQYGIIKHILDKKEGIGSGDMHAHLELQGYKISRSSVIYYLQTLAKNGIINQKTGMGKGGARAIYSAKLNFKDILTNIVETVMDKLLEAFPNSNYSKYLKTE